MAERIDAKKPTIVPIEQAGMAGLGIIPNWFSGTQCAKDCVIELLGAFDVARPDHHMTKHSLSPEVACQSALKLRFVPPNDQGNRAAATGLEYKNAPTAAPGDRLVRRRGH